MVASLIDKGRKVHNYVAPLGLLGLVLGLLAGTLMVLSPRQHRGIQDRVIGIILSATALIMMRPFIGVLLRGTGGRIIVGASASHQGWVGLLLPLGLLVLGLWAFLRPNLPGRFFRGLYPERSLSDSELKRGAWTIALMITIAGILFLIFSIMNF